MTTCQPPQAERLYKVIEVADELSVSRWALYHWIRSGLIAQPLHTPTGQMRFTRQAIDAIRRQMQERPRVKLGRPVGSLTKTKKR